MPASVLPIAPSRSSSTDSTETVKPTGRLVAQPRTSSSFDRSRRSARPGSTASRSRSTSRNAQHALRPLSPTTDSSPADARTRTSHRTRPSQTTIDNSSPAAAYLASHPRRPSLTLSTKLADRVHGGDHASATLPSPAPSPSRLCPALSLPLLSANEASIQVSSVVVQGELDNTAGNTPGVGIDVHEYPASTFTGGGGGAKEMLETLRDKGTLVVPDEEGEPLYRYEIPNLTQPFVLPSLERNPRLPANLFDCTNTISIPDLPPTHPLPSRTAAADEDQVMNMLPSPVSPDSSSPRRLPSPFTLDQSSSSLSRTRSRSGPRSSHDPPATGRHSRKVSFSLLPTPSASSSSPPPLTRHASDSIRPPRVTPAACAASSKSSATTSSSGFLLGKRRQLAGLDTTRYRDLVEEARGAAFDHPKDEDSWAKQQQQQLDVVVHETGGGGGVGRGAKGVRNVKKRPALISYTSFEDEFGLKPPRLDGDYDREYAGYGSSSLTAVGDDETSGGEPGARDGVEGDGKKERKWWHLSG